MQRNITAGTLVALLTAASTCAGAATKTILDASCYWRRYYRFGVSRVSADLLKDQGQALLGRRRYMLLKRQTERRLTRSGVNLHNVDWRDHVIHAAGGARAFNPSTTPPPPATWTAAEFDDAAWARDRGLFQGGPLPGITNIVLGQYAESVDLRLRTACYRGRFLVNDPARAGDLTLRLVYTGGVQVFLNGRLVARGHLPAGSLDPETPAEGYPAAAYRAKTDRLARRTLGPITLAARLLRKGTNILAVEVRASPFHPVALTNKIQPNWGGPGRPWPHAKLLELHLAAASDQVVSAAERPAGLRLWVEDMHHRVLSSDYGPPGPHRGVVRFVGARNGTYAAQLVVGCGPRTAPITRLSARPSDLKHTTARTTLPASCIRVLHMLPFPTERWTLQYLGDERGLSAKFPDLKELAAWRAAPAHGSPWLFDRLTTSTGESVAPGTSRPIWLSLRVPSDARPGTYQGTVKVSVTGRPPLDLPVEVEVVDWTLPDPKQFRTVVGCEQNPYGVAEQYNVTPWSDRHFKLMEPSFRQLTRVGNQWLNVPVLLRTEFGNRSDTMIRWIRRKDGQLTFDYAVLDRYLGLAVKHWGRPRVVHFIVMQGMKSSLTPPAPHRVTIFDEATGKSSDFAITNTLKPVWPPRGQAPLSAAQRAAWKAFATSLFAHMKQLGLAKSMYWGAPWEVEANPDLKNRLAAWVPGVYWTAGPHEMMSNGTFAKNEKFYRIVTDIRYHGGWPSFRDDMGWKSKTLHLLNPRVGGTAFALHTTSHPFAYRCMVDRALALGRSGFSRVGADEWAGVHYRGMDLPKWLTGIPVLFLLWPGEQGAESSARFEALIEGVQETEARIFIEQALDRGRLPRELANRARALLRRRSRDTDFWQGNSIIYSMERYHHGWQERSRALYRMAAEVTQRAGGN